MASDEPEQYRKLFIGGLNYFTTDDSLKEFFEKWGEVVDVVVMKDPQTRRSRGFGFISYSHSSMVDRAMLNRPHKIDGREVETKRAVPRDDVNKPEIAATVRKMFIYGIKEQSVNDLLDYFRQFGNIINITIVTDKDSGQRKGFGFIEYDDTDSVDKAVLFKSHEVAGGKLDVKKAISRNDGAGGSRGGRGGGGGVVGNRSISGGNPRNEQWRGHHNRSNGSKRGYGNSGMRGGYGFGGGGNGYGSSAGGYNSNSGGTWQGGGGDSWGDSQQPSNNWGPNQSYGGGGGPIRPNYTFNNRTTPYGNPGAGNVNACNTGYGQNPGRRY